MIDPDPPVAQDNNINDSRHISLAPISTEIIRDVVGNLNADEKEMISRGVIPLKVLEKFTGFKKSQILPIISEYIPRNVIISATDRIEAIIHNGKDGSIKIKRLHLTEDSSERESVYEVMRFNGHIGPVLRINQNTPGIKFTTPWSEVKLSVSDFLSHARSVYSLSVGQVQNLKLILDALVSEEYENGNIENFLTSPVSVFNDTIVVDFPDIDNSQSLAHLREFLEKSSHPNAFLAILGQSVTEPFHHELKQRARTIIQPPPLIFSGRTKGGKTELASFFAGTGFKQGKDEFFFSHERVGTRFTFMAHMAETNLPAVLDDVAASFIYNNKEALKSYVQTGHFADRGRGDQTLTEYKGARSFIITTNDDIVDDEDLALHERFIVERFTETNSAKMDRLGWVEFTNSMPEGFMLGFIKELFNGKNINDVLADVIGFESPVEWVNYGLERINLLCKKYNIPKFPSYEVRKNDSYSIATEIFQAFVAEDQRIRLSEQETEESDGDGSFRNVRRVRYRSPIEGEFSIEIKEENGGNRIFVYFTGGAFKTLMARQYLKAPYQNATTFLNNIDSREDGVRVENNGKQISKRFGDAILKVFAISAPELKEGEP